MQPTELTFAEAFQVKVGKIVNKDYFYIPVFYHNESHSSDWTWYSLRFNYEAPPESLTAYASKVQAGESIKHALMRDLAKDFHYPMTATFVIDELYAHGSAVNKRGETLTRMLVIVGLDEKIDTEHLHPLGMNVRWYNEGDEEYNLVKDYFPPLERWLFHEQSYVHIPMDGSRPADPNLNGHDEYYLPDGSLIKPPEPIWF